jgi:hypothetical protein
MTVRDPWLTEKISMIEKLGWPALAGFVLVVIGLTVASTPDLLKTSLIVFGIVLAIPFIFYLNILTVWHWKRRYRGKHSDLWGAILLIETSGWFKIIYWVRHIVPDWRGSGRYVGNSSPEPPV